MTTRRRAGLLAVGTALAVVLCGCGGPTFSSLPLPGSGVSGKTVNVSAEFAEALNLAQGASVRVNGVDSGRVTDVTVHNFRARVDMKVKTDADLRRGATAKLRYTTPLGELFVDVTNPAAGPLMRGGELLPLAQTATAPTVEDALSQASMLVNGGGLAQLQTITTEANKALGGHEDNIRDLLGRSTYLLGQINASSADIDRTLNALAEVSEALNERKQVIHQALADVRPAAAALRANTANISALLSSLNTFAGTANSVVAATRTQVLQLVREAGPLLQELVSVRGVLPETLRAIVKLGQILDRVFPGDYFNLGTHLKLDRGQVGDTVFGLDSLLDLLGGGSATGKTASGTTASSPSGTGTTTTPSPSGSLLGTLLDGLLRGGS
jgi:phospholipid/cholesterol/gamma-HCH transport system substrate-binding protein